METLYQNDATADTTAIALGYFVGSFSETKEEKNL